MLYQSDVERILYHNPYKPRRSESPEVFTISSLARGVKAEYDRKIDPKRPSNDNSDTMHGKAIHAYLQERFAKEGYQREIGVVTKIPYEYTYNGMHVNEMVLVGYVDLFHPTRHEVIELKSTLKDRALIAKHMKVQLAMYTSLLEQKYNQEMQAQILRVSAKEESLYSLTRNEIEEYSQLVIDRAKEVADMLNGQMMVVHEV